jgi:hypothetical protein
MGASQEVLLARDSPSTVCTTLRLLGAAVGVMPPLLTQLQRQGVLSLVRRLATAATAAATAAPNKGKAAKLSPGRRSKSPAGAAGASSSKSPVASPVGSARGGTADARASAGASRLLAQP